MFCEVMNRKPEFTDLITHKLKHHPDQMESVVIMEYVLGEIPSVKHASKLHEMNHIQKPK